MSHSGYIASTGRARPVRKGLKLNLAQVEEIRNRRVAGESADEISKRFDVSSTTVVRVCRGLIWPAAPGPLVPARGTVGTAERFWARVDQVNGPVHPTLGRCWPWTRKLSSNGYGRITVDGEVVRAHRVAYELAKGAIGADLVVRHRCDFKRCCNPDHLLTGTVSDNAIDAVERGQIKRGSRHSRTRLTEADVIAIRQRRADGETPSQIAPFFGTTGNAIGMICRGRNWKHVPMAPLSPAASPGVSP